jgi:hypothetical protein
LGFGKLAQILMQHGDQRPIFICCIARFGLRRSYAGDGFASCKRGGGGHDGSTVTKDK